MCQVNAIAYYLAIYLSKMPEAQAMPPKQLQDAIRVAMQVGGVDPFICWVVILP